MSLIALRSPLYFLDRGSSSKLQRGEGESGPERIGALIRRAFFCRAFFPRLTPGIAFQHRADRGGVVLGVARLHRLGVDRLKREFALARACRTSARRGNPRRGF